MKSPLIMFIVLAVGSTANAILQLSVDGALDVEEIYLGPSDIVHLGIHGDGTTSSGQEFYIHLTGAATLDYSEWSSEWNPQGVGILDLGDGLYYVDLAVPVFPPPALPAESVIDGIALVRNGWSGIMVRLYDGTFTLHDTLRINRIPAGPPVTHYVDGEAVGANNGYSWANAFNSLQDALKQAWYGDEILVAQGTYTPDKGAGIMSGDRDAAFQLVNGVRVRGGYAGWGEADPNARDIASYRTVLSGDIGLLGDDSDNSRHVFYHSLFAQLDRTAVLDGVTITGGCGEGGGMYNRRCSPLITNCTFAANIGGAMYNDDSSPAVTNCVFIANLATYGAGIYNSTSSPEITNCAFTGNRATDFHGAGMYSANSDPVVANCIFWNDLPEEIRHAGSGVSSVSFSVVQGCWVGEGNIDADPCFVAPGFWDPNGTPDDANDDFWFNGGGDYHLRSQGGRYDPVTQTWIVDDVTSPCIDAGDPMMPVGLEPFANGGIVNMGAYGGAAEASKSYFGGAPCERIVAGDINGDCIVNFLDFSIMALRFCGRF